MIKNTFIYALCCPITEEVKYIGKSNNPKQRLSKHKSVKDNNIDKKLWIDHLLKNNLSPKLKILEEVSIEEWKEKEKFYIKKYKDLGYNLYNICGGANGSEFGNSGSFDGSNAIKVVCLSKDGEYINTFDSIKSGIEFCGTNLSNVLSGKTKKAGGYLWIYKYKYDKLSEIELKKFVENCNVNNSHKNGEKTRFKKGQKSWNKGLKGIKLKPNKYVYQYSKDLEFIKMWTTAKEASIELTGNDKNEENIAKCARGNSRTSIGYKWFYELK
jgi:predicted GIY-YIG superfamily endonuclease